MHDAYVQLTYFKLLITLLLHTLWAGLLHIHGRIIIVIIHLQVVETVYLHAYAYCTENISIVNNC